IKKIILILLISSEGNLLPYMYHVLPGNTDAPGRMWSKLFCYKSMPKELLLIKWLGNNTVDFFGHSILWKAMSTFILCRREITGKGIFFRCVFCFHKTSVHLAYFFAKRELHTDVI